MGPGTERSGAGTTAPLGAIELEEALVALTDGVVVCDAEGRVASTNPAAFRLLGEDELLGRPFDDLLLVSGAATVQRTEGHVVRRAWFPREERMGVLEIVSTGVAERGWIHTVRDVTAQAEMLRLKEDFLLQVAHELRTPIASMTASLDLLQQDAATMARDDLERMLGTLRRSALRLEHLVENLLDAGSIEAGTFQVRTTSTTIRQALREALEFVQPLLDGKAQRLVPRIAAGADRVLADPRRTAQVLSNLIANASKYAPESTAVTVSTASADGAVEIIVSDEGPGIPEDERGRLFQPFFRSREVREAAGGVGLGLTICRAIVQAQGGDIRIESTRDSGTSIHFTIPKARELTEEASGT
ncbi:MAG: PAS domain-containing sensor histidine kinase [Chloroflexota bacterium]|nr:PAS domain-containing sensor histidine kinase [Chloroflexota bacterium]